VAIIQVASHYYHRMHHVDDPLWEKISARVLSELGFGPEDDADFYDLISARFLDRT
jgi:hypothetical protein